MDDIFEQVSALLEENLDPDMAGVIDLNATAKSHGSGVVLSAAHKRLANASVEGSLGVCYEGSVSDTDYTFETVLNAGENTQINLTLSNLFGLGDTFGYKSEVSHGVGNETSHSVEWERSSDNFSTTFALEKPDGDSGILAEPSLVYSHEGTQVGLSAKYDGGAARFLKGAFAMSQKLADVTLAFVAGVSREEGGTEVSFDAGVNFEASERLTLGGAFSRSTGAEAEVSVGGRYDLENGVEVKAKATTAGLYALAWTVLLSSHLTATLLLQHSMGTPRSGLTLTYDSTEEDADAGDPSVED